MNATIKKNKFRFGFSSQMAWLFPLVYCLAVCDVRAADFYRLRFGAGSQKEGTWDPAYCDFFRTPRQVHEKIAHQEARINDWRSAGGRL